jgi:hypothetical protein
MRVSHLKRILRLGRLRLRGPRGAQDEFTLAAIAHGSSAREHIINLPHDPLGPLNRSGNHGLGPRARLGIEEVVGKLQVTRHEYPRHNRHHALAYVTVAPVAQEIEPINYNPSLRGDSWQI